MLVSHSITLVFPEGYHYMLWRYVIQGYKEQSPSARYIKFQCNTHMKGRELWSISRLFLLSFPQSPANFQSTPRSQTVLDYLNKIVLHLLILPLSFPKATTCPLTPDGALFPPLPTESPSFAFLFRQRKNFILSRRQSGCKDRHKRTTHRPDLLPSK